VSVDTTTHGNMHRDTSELLESRVCNPSSPKHFSNNVLCINMLEEKFGLLLVATFW
jgi:hypothetical protein